MLIHFEFCILLDILDKENQDLIYNYQFHYQYNDLLQRSDMNQHIEYNILQKKHMSYKYQDYMAHKHHHLRRNHLDIEHIALILLSTDLLNSHKDYRVDIDLIHQDNTCHQYILNI